MANLCKRYDVMCLSDEVYEWLVYSGSEHIKIGKHNVNRRLNIFAVRSKEHIFFYIFAQPPFLVCGRELSQLGVQERRFMPLDGK